MIPVSPLTDLTPIYVPHAIRELSTFSVLFGAGAGPAEAGAEAKQAAANAACAGMTRSRLATY